MSTTHPLAFFSPLRPTERHVAVPPANRDAREPGGPRAIRAAALIALSFALLAGGCLAAAAMPEAGRLPVEAAAFAGYVLAFSRGLGTLPVDWNAWRADWRPSAGGRRRRG